jgi:hypothetical protein
MPMDRRLGRPRGQGLAEFVQACSGLKDAACWSRDHAVTVDQWLGRP